MIIPMSEGVRPSSPEQEEELKSADYTNCYTHNCNFFFSPQTQSAVMDQGGGYYTCPKCKYSHDLKQETPYMRPEEHEEARYIEGPGGGGTIVGLSMIEQGDIGEGIIEKMGEIPGYGPITWWHSGGSGGKSALDGTTADWGIEVKTIAYDAKHHRFVPGRTYEKEEKNSAVQELGLKGILGVLVLLDYRRSVADVYVREMPSEPWVSGAGRTLKGAYAFRSGDAEHLVKEVPFVNPYLDPANPAPAPANPW